jgi:hypothetical protein
MPEFTEIKGSEKPESTPAAPSATQLAVRRSRRRRNPIASNSRRDVKCAAAIGPCDVSTETIPAIPTHQPDRKEMRQNRGEDRQERNRKYSTAVVGIEENDDMRGERRIIRRQFRPSGQKEFDGGGRRGPDLAPMKKRMQKGSPGLLGKIMRVLWPFGKKQKEEQLQRRRTYHRRGRDFRGR